MATIGTVAAPTTKVILVEGEKVVQETTVRTIDAADVAAEAVKVAAQIERFERLVESLQTKLTDLNATLVELAK